MRKAKSEREAQRRRFETGTATPEDHAARQASIDEMLDPAKQAERQEEEERFRAKREHQQQRWADSKRLRSEHDRLEKEQEEIQWRWDRGLTSMDDLKRIPKLNEELAAAWEALQAHEASSYE